MKRSAIFALLILALAAAQAWAAEPAESSRAELTFTLAADRPYEVPPGPWTERTAVFARPELEKAVGKTIPTFTRTIVARGKSFRYTMVGSDPFVRQTKKIVVPVEIIPVRFEFDDGSVFDPTQPNLSCQPPGTALGLALASPIFQDVNYGDGNRQFVEEFRRLEFWTHTAPGANNAGYSVRVAARVLPTAVIKITGFFTQALTCGRLGFMDINTWDNFLQGTVFPQLRKQGVTPQTFPLFLFANVVMFDGDKSKCCIRGYHNAFNSGGIQTYGVANYDLTGSDAAVISHELAEWYDDPFGANMTPPWGHTGQVRGCQADLEVGDPLTGTTHAILMPNGFTYHPQELAFFSWFFDVVPSLGINGWYSSGGTFLAPADPCF